MSVFSGLTTAEGAQFGLESIFGPLLLGGFFSTLYVIQAVVLYYKHLICLLVYSE